jgi:putative transposase
MLMKKQIHKRTPQEKERILQEIERLGVVAGCRKHGLSRNLYYEWLDRYNSQGLAGLEDRRGKNLDAMMKKLEKENRILKELLAEKELESKLKDELLKKKIAQWNKESN